MLTRRTIIVAATCLLASSLCAPVAAAQYGGPEQIDPTSSALWAELGFYRGGASAVAPVADADLTVLAPVLEGYFGITDSLELGFRWGSSFVARSADGLGDGDSAFAIGNPVAMGTYLARMDDVVLRLGIGVGLPVAGYDASSTSVDEITKGLGYAVASALRGWWDSWMWADDRLTVVVPRFRLDSTSNDLVWAVDAAMGLMVDTSDADRDVEVPVQAALEGGGRLGSSLVVGGRLQAVWIPTRETGDDFQLAVEPFVRVELENVFFYSKLTLNLDGPNGFAFDRGKVWGAHIGGGTRF